MPEILVFEGRVPHVMNIKPQQRIYLGHQRNQVARPQLKAEEQWHFFESMKVSKEHGVLSCDHTGQVWYEDRDSTNGSWLRIDPFVKQKLPASFGLMLGNEVTLMVQSELTQGAQPEVELDTPEELLAHLRQRFSRLSMSFDVGPVEPAPSGVDLFKRLYYPLIDAGQFLVVRTEQVTFNDSLDSEIQAVVFHYNSARASDEMERCRFIAMSAGRKEALLRARRVAGKRHTVLISGPTGCGKEVLAEVLHRLSPRASRPYLPVNCAALPENLFEAELFGYAKGIHNLAKTDKQGVFEACRGGTVVLDEIQALPLALQAKLLRVLESNKVRRIGDPQEREADFRVIALTNEDLPELVRRGRFREDLYQRLHVLAIAIPPIEEADVYSLVSELLQRVAKAGGREFTRAQSQQIAQLAAARRWPGNVRQLYNALVTLDALYEPGDLLEDAWELAVGKADAKNTAGNPRGAGSSASPKPSVTSCAGDSSPERAVRPPAADEIDPGSARAGMPAAQTLHQLIFLGEARDVLIPPRQGALEQLAQRLGITAQAVCQRLRNMGAPPWHSGPEFADWLKLKHGELQDSIRAGQPYLTRLIGSL